MSSTEFGWESLLHTDAPSACYLKGALFTTYDTADERLLVEHLLPMLLKINHQPDGDGPERQYFLLELDRQLKQLHDRLIVVSSTAREESLHVKEEREAAAYGWIWQSIRQLTVGSRGKAVQHAKLWMLHWSAAADDDMEYLELVVSSANLTLSAFKGQLQAAWRTCIELHPQTSNARLSSWGVLPQFLKELAASAGEEDRLNPFVELLARADSPANATFVASVPGTYSRQTLRRTPWGAAGLNKIVPPGRGSVRMSVLSPFIGSWDVETLTRWCEMFDGAPNRLELIWIDKTHPWARECRWILPEATLKTLTELEATLLHLRRTSDEPETTDCFHQEHRLADDRWSHAKIYLLQRGTSRRLLVTSANFSQAAWGKANPDGNLTIDNFELGVCVPQVECTVFGNLGAFENLTDVATTPGSPPRSSNAITWTNAVWDGRTVTICCRCDADSKLFGELIAGENRTPIANWSTDSDGRRRLATVRWADVIRIPSWVQLTCGVEVLTVPVFDERSIPEREATVPPEVDADLVQSMRDELLFEQYGGRVAAEEIGDADVTSDFQDAAVGGDPRLEKASPQTAENSVFDPEAVTGSESEFSDAEGGRSDSYSVPSFDLARRYLQVVDNWKAQVSHADGRAGRDFELQLLRRDGELLVKAFERQSHRESKQGALRGLGPKLATEELALLLKQFPGE